VKDSTVSLKNELSGGEGGLPEIKNRAGKVVEGQTMHSRVKGRFQKSKRENRKEQGKCKASPATLCIYGKRRM